MRILLYFAFCFFVTMSVSSCDWGQFASIDLHTQFKSVWLYCVFQSNARYFLEQGEQGPAKRPFFISQFPENSEDNGGDRSRWGRLPLFNQESPGEQPSHHHCSDQRSVTGRLFLCHISKIFFSHIIHWPRDAILNHSWTWADMKEPLCFLLLWKYSLVCQIS